MFILKNKNSKTFFERCVHFNRTSAPYQFLKSRSFQMTHLAPGKAAFGPGLKIPPGHMENSSGSGLADSGRKFFPVRDFKLNMNESKNLDPFESHI